MSEVKKATFDKVSNDDIKKLSKKLAEIGPDHNFREDMTAREKEKGE